MASRSCDASTERAVEGPSIRLAYKHPLAIRWMHWINFPVLFLMIWSGLLIDWNDSDNAYLHPRQISAPLITATVTFEFIMQQSYAEHRDRGPSERQAGIECIQPDWLAATLDIRRLVLVSRLSKAIPSAFSVSRFSRGEFD